MDLEDLTRSGLGRLVIAPWFDPVAMRAVAHWYLPLSRAWAAALSCDGTAGDFIAQSGARRIPAALVSPALARARRRDRLYRAADARFDEAVFGGAAGPEALKSAASERARAADALMGARWQFVLPHVAARFPAVRWDVASESEVLARHGARLGDLANAFAPPASLAPPRFKPERSAAVPGRRGAASWLRFPAPVESVGGTAWARVIVPEREHAPRRHPVVVFAHGIAMETEFWRGQSAPPRLFAARDIAMIRPEGPFHGRRRVPGCYGGEPVIARGPMGLLDYFHCHVVELGLLVAWARATFGAPVALGGVSLGALAAQRAAVAANAWPAEMRPDALLLVTPSASIAAAALGGSLPRAAGVPEALAAAGWTAAGFERWSPLIECGGVPAVDPARIVVTLGMTDDVTPYEEGERLIGDWRVPAGNVFRRRLGHFSTSLALLRDSAPLARLADLLDGIN